MTARLRFFATTGILTACLLGTLLSLDAHAQTTFVSTGFEASEGYSTTYTAPTTVSSNGVPVTTFTPVAGNLWEEPRTNEKLFSFTNTGNGSGVLATDIQNSINSTTVVNTSAATGTQSVQMIGSTIGNQSLEWFAVRDLVAGAGAGTSLTMSVDMRVTSPNAAFGQWGLNFREQRNGLGLTVGAFGFAGTNILASNDGTTIYAAINLSTGAAYTTNYGTYNNYAIRMNYDTRTISGFFNNAQVGFIQLNANNQPIVGTFALNMPFGALTGNTISTASFGQGLPGGSGENANFDNYRVVGTNVTAAAPEPGTLALFGTGVIGGMGLIRRRKKA